MGTGGISLHVSFLEIYNELIRDLLVLDGHEKVALELQEDPARGMVVPHLTEIEIKSMEQIEDVLYLGNMRRTMASTGANLVSSRSHAILQMTVTQSYPSPGGGRPTCRSSKLSLCGLAGSERGANSDNRGARAQEAAQINRSLLSLANCINALAEGQGAKNQGLPGATQRKRTIFVPYRDSKLTRLLKDSLGGNTMTFMIANVSPATKCLEELRRRCDRERRIRGI